MSTKTLAYPRVTHAALPATNWKYFCMACFLASIMLLVFYVWQINTLTGGAYKVSSMEKQLAELSKENKNLQVSFAESGYMADMVQKAAQLNFEKATGVKYVQIKSSEFVMAK